MDNSSKVNNLSPIFNMEIERAVQLRSPRHLFMEMEQFKGHPRLPKWYDITLKPDLTACSFGGSVAVHLDIVCRPLRRCRFRVFRFLQVETFEEDGILVLEFGETLPIGSGVLGIRFEGILNDKMKGFYRSTYEHNGEKKNMAVTQFAPVDARRCFPCWDEPAWKATFKIRLDDVPSELVALSNVPIVEEKVDGHLKTVSFQESPIMSTYLVAVVVGLFDYVEDHTSDGVKVRVYCQVGKANEGKFALDVAVKTLEFYKDYFAVPYSLPKLDMVAIPDFPGAMENYGLVTYQETTLLFDEQHSAAANKQWVATAVAHELVHQWFGNLVTMEWWTLLWPKEGFATWVSYLVTDSLFPEWKMWAKFLDEITGGLKLDGLEGSHLIEVEINHAAEVVEIFDAISYRKGGSVIRMLQNYLGASMLVLWSLAAYIKKHAFSNAETEDLWAALQEGSGEPVNKLMNSWTQQKGYPVISVKVKDQKLEFEQISNKLATIAADAVPELLDLINQFFIGLFQYSAEKLGWEPKPGESQLDAMLRGDILTALALSSFEKVNEVDEFFKFHPNPSITRTLKQSIEQVQINAKWVHSVQSVQSEKHLADVVTELATGNTRLYV
ncbi:unnamed protein product [Prunus armeniaca]|uniref:Uncharacterized protein n=1 Tax=Prunus armeniaca TaxID=36596 RepID=A0A6J5TTS5_PRUAR|nr:unnamed protein product [Prunus armeniaca]